MTLKSLASHARVPPGDRPRAPKVCVVLPIYNEQENLRALVARLLPVLERSTHGLFEVVWVDDGSDDGSAELLDAFHGEDPRMKVIHFSRNFGHQAALQAGLDTARADAVVLMDADLQDPPELVEQFLEKWVEGYDVVYAVRKQRREGFVKRAAYRLFYRSLKAIAQVDVPLDAGDFCLLDQRVVAVLRSLRERNRFVRGLRSWVGFRQVGIEYAREARHAGAPKYTFQKLMELALSGYIGFSAMPLHMATWLGLLFSTTGFAIAIWVVITKLLDPAIPHGWASTLAVLCVTSGVNLLMLGIIGEYLNRVYDEVRQRPLYVVRSSRGMLESPVSERERRLDELEAMTPPARASRVIA